MFPTHRSDPSDWPEIDYSSGAGTAALLRLYSQVVGKVRLVQSPWVNHSWHVRRSRPAAACSRWSSTFTIMSS